VPRFLATLLLMILLLNGMLAGAQNGGTAQQGDPPIASLIDISEPDASGIVTINGAPGAVFPAAQVAIRNLYTEQVVYTQAGLTGTFEARLFGPGNTPFWVSPAVSIPPNLRDRPGSLPGGPGTIVFGAEPFNPPASLPTTQIIIDGQARDWRAYPNSLLQSNNDYTVYGLHNTESLYLGLELANPPEAYFKLIVEFTLEGATYRATLDPRRVEEAATWKRTTPIEADLGVLAAVKTQADAIELRLPLSPLRSTLGAALESARLERFDFLTADNTALLSIPVALPLPGVEEVDGLVYTPDSEIADPVRFTVSGPVAQGASVWHANGRINQLNFAPGDHLRLQLDVMLNAPALPETLVGLGMVGQLRLQPIINADGLPAPGGLNSNNGWSAILTPSGLPIDNLRSDRLLGEAVTVAPRVLRRDNQLLFGLDFDLTLPEELPAGTYGLVFEGWGQIGDGERFRWRDNGLLGNGGGLSRVAINRLPVVLNVGTVTDHHLIWSLFVDDPSEGSRGILAAQDAANAALSNRVRFNSPTYILPLAAGQQPRTYPLEPYMLAQLPNAYDTTGAPLIPLALPGGQITVRVTRPDGTVDDLGRSAILQNRLSTFALDERTRFGGQSPVDVYRLTTLNPRLTSYQFEQYGRHTIELRGSVDDLWDQRYMGGGTYEVLIAELLDMQPGVLSGTPFEVGDTLYPGLQVMPGVPADVTVTARVYPLDGGAVIERTFTGQANRYGYFTAAGLRLSAPGEYVIDYEARFTDSQGRLWAGSLRSAGVIAAPDSPLIAHGRRGLGDYQSRFRPAWFTTRAYGPDDAPTRLNYPYHTGDVLWYTADSRNTVQPGITIQDLGETYQAWLVQALADYMGTDGLTMDRRAVRDELPVVMPPDGLGAGAAYTYLSAVRPGITVRQFVLGSDDPGLPLYWDMDDPYNEQIGAGVTGDQVGDYTFLFGGAVVRNPSAEVRETAIYAAAGFVIDDADPLGARVYPPYRGAAGGADGGPLVTIRDEPITMFFHPTSLRPGQILTVGDTLALAGQMAPTLPAHLQAEITRPDGTVHAISGQANRIGYFYDPAQNLVVDEPGLWTIDLEVTYTDGTSAGSVEEPYPTGGILGTEQFVVYVIPANAQPLQWNDTRQDIAIPGALPYNFNFPAPSGWTNVQVHHTVTTPSYVLRSGPLPLSGSSFSFQHNPTNLNAAFPNIEVDARLDGPAAADPVTITFVALGTDAEGQMQMRSRVFTILYDRLLTLE
jgi:hypothetical protein